MNKKYLEYATIINSQIADVFEEDSDNHIDLDELHDEENLKSFIYALSTVVPNYLLNKFTGEVKNHLEFNHIANHLIFEFSKNVED